MQSVAAIFTLSMAAVIVYELVRNGSNAPNATVNITNTVAGFYQSLMTK